jgi:hypothetical protein
MMGDHEIRRAEPTSATDLLRKHFRRHKHRPLFNSWTELMRTAGMGLSLCIQVAIAIKLL